LRSTRAAQLLLEGRHQRAGVITLTRDNWSAPRLWSMATQGYFVLGTACYVVSLFVWILACRGCRFGGLSAAVGPRYLSTRFAAHYLLGETVTLQRWLGIGPSSSPGVWLVARS